MRKPLEDWVLRILLLHWGSGSFDVRPCDVGQNREEGNVLLYALGVYLRPDWPDVVKFSEHFVWIYDRIGTHLAR